MAVKNPLAVKNFGKVELSITPEADLIKQQALAVAAEVSAVTDAETQEHAAGVVGKIKGILKSLESSRKEVKSPVIDLGKKIDEKAKSFAAELIEECTRIEKLIQDHFRAEAAKAEKMRRMQEQLAKAKAEKAAAEAHAAAEERRRLEAEAAKAKSEEDAERLRTEARNRDYQQAAAMARAEAAAAPRPPAAMPERASNMRAGKRARWELEDIHKLYRAQPGLCRIEPNSNAIQMALRAGQREIPGLKIWEEIKTTVTS